jgi:hypothetical protein
LVVPTDVVSIIGCAATECQTAKTDQTKWYVRIVSHPVVVVAVAVAAVYHGIVVV